jgi:hypothetical protein
LTQAAVGLEEAGEACPWDKNGFTLYCLNIYSLRNITRNFVEKTKEKIVMEGGGGVTPSSTFPPTPPFFRWLLLKFFMRFDLLLYFSYRINLLFYEQNTNSMLEF